MRQEISSYLSTIKDDILNLSKYIHENPEDSFHEFKAYNYIINMLKNNNFNITEHYLDIPTAFYAQYGTGHPKICYICEYDAVKDLGHVVGHNLISAMSIAASLSLSKIIPKIGGSVVVIGCPGEFLGSSKVTMTKQGTFNDIDVVLMAHPDVITAESGSSMAIIPMKISYKSKSGFTYRKTKKHTALDACLFVFNTLSLLSKGFEDNCTIDGIILKGGDSPYLLPSETESKFYIRCPKMSMACEIEKKVQELVKTTSYLMNVDCSVCLYELPYDELIQNKNLSRIFSHNLKESGIIDIDPPKDTNSGLSLGTVSQVVPCIHPYISICEDKNIEYSSKEFSEATISYYAQDKIIKVAQALALTGLDLIENASLLNQVKKEFFNVKNGRD
ncbi:M20 family metallopeptidase [Clostridium sp. P21]|uniref:Peptidase M20 domain-containing protein 2 n=1 Tax=Clostridium muellerianum TaxID=2716538 RepID=A0A7Y0EEK2_9CLOT|nr:M20 family peptidase [Clostridium muellerianum]NMM61647.1 M20 family metallopeptidase [Clostridium muellerianum]